MRQGSAVHGDGARETLEFRIVHDDHGGRRGIRWLPTLRRVQPPFRGLEEGIDAVELAGRHEGADISDGQHRSALHQLAGKRLEPAAQGRLLSSLPHRGARQLDQVRRPLEVLGRQRVADGFGPIAVLLIPLARPPVQVRGGVGLLVQQARSQHVGEQVVIPIPLATVVERDQEEVPALQGLQHGLATGLAGHGIAQRTAQPVEDRGPQQEASDVVGLTLQDLFREVIDDVAIVPGEARDEAGDVASSLHGKPCELQGGDPPFGARLQCGDITRA